MNSKFLYLEDNGDFGIESPELTNQLYFPLVNEAGMMSDITPLLGGDCKIGQKMFALPPVTVYELHNNRSTRNFWLYFKDADRKWSAAGASAQQLQRQTGEKKEKTNLDAGLLWHRITRLNEEQNMRSVITSFVPTENDYIELTKIELTNTGDKSVAFKPYTAIPLFGRSADNLRDHRHVTSLLNRCTVCKQGIVLHPVLSFDEKDHKKNNISYGVFCMADDGAYPIAACPSVNNFIGDGGTFETPISIGSDFKSHLGDTVDGEEIIAALQMPDVSIAPGDTKAYIIGICIYSADGKLDDFCEKYASVTQFDDQLARCRRDWKTTLDLSFCSGDRYRDGWMKWVSIQPVLRRIFGCSFLPHYDYGRGGRGWRDLWQDCLSLLLMHPDNVRTSMVNFFAGVRTDGSNATIIGDVPGEFIVDRNGVTRVWMDHAAWPMFTVMLYIMQTDDLKVLFEKQMYFRDKRTHRGKYINQSWKPENGQWLLKKDGEKYYGTIFEHLLVENLSAVYSVGEHNVLRLEDGDWNDGLDMASHRGESVAFSCFYYYNLLCLCELCQKLYDSGITSVTVSEKLLLLIDSDACSAESKAEVFRLYLDTCDQMFAEQVTEYDVLALAARLKEKSKVLYEVINRQEWISDGIGNEWYNSYYDDCGRRAEGNFDGNVRMMLTGQVYAVMSGIADDSKIKSIIKAADRYLYTDKGGYRLNSDFKEQNFNLGRMFGFAYGTKENGSVFSHMAVMYAYALYLKGYVKAGYRVINELYRGSRNFDVSGIYPGIPEYFEPDGHANYPYLTGSASWLIFVMLTQVYGVRGNYGNLLIEPKLVKEQFDANGNASVHLQFCERRLSVTYQNVNQKEYGDYLIASATLDGEEIISGQGQKSFEISKSLLKDLCAHNEHQINVVLK